MLKENKFKRNENFICRKLGEDQVLVPIHQTGVDVQRIFSLNYTAFAVWEILHSSKSFENIIAELEEAFDVSKEDIEKDVSLLLAEFLENEFIHPVGG